MKKNALLFAAIFVGLATTILSCKKSNVSDNQLQLKMYYLGTYRDYTTLAGMRVDSTGYTLLTGQQGGTVNKFTLRLGGNTTGDYKITGKADTANYMKVYKGYITYTTQAAGGWGMATISKLDTDSLWAKGSFNGTVVNLANPADSFSVTQGMFNIQYQR